MRLATSCPILARFIGGVYRRLVLLRLLEGAGLGTVVGSMLAIIFLGIMMYRGDAVPPSAVLVPLMGAGVGVLWTALRRPNPVHAAYEADRQLGLADLLSTAWSLTRHPSAATEFTAAVLAVAEARCTALSPSAVVLRRLGGRAWGGIGLVCALAVTLGLLSANPIESEASSLRSTADAKAAMARNKTASGLALDTARPPGGRDTTKAPDYPNAQENGFNPSRNPSSADHGAGESNQNTDTADPEGAGMGSGRSQSSGPTDPLAAAGTEASRSGQGETAAGTGSAAENGAAGRGPSGARGGSGVPVRPAPAWATSVWPAARQAADAAVRSGRIPQEFQDLVREYFGRP